MKKGVKISIIIVAVIIVAFIVFKYTASGNEGTITAETIKVEKGSVTTMVTATGTVEPINQVDVGTQVSGEVDKIYVDYNSVVKQGQLIAELDKTNLKSTLVQNKASYQTALSERDYLQTIFDRQSKLFENKVISQADYDEAYYNLEVAKQTVVQRQSEMEKAETDLSYANIYSPIDGVVLSRDIDEGQTVAASFSTPTLFTIAQDLSEMQVEADVDEADIGQVKEGQRVSFTVDAYQGEVFNGVVTQVRLDPTETSNVITYTVVIKAENPDLKLMPGLTATISIYTLELKDVLTIEAKAVNFQPTPNQLAMYNTMGEEGGERPSGPPPSGRGRESGKDASSDKDLLWKYISEGNIKPQEVTLGASDGVNVQIIEGAEEGDVFVYNFKSEVEHQMPAGDAESPFMPKPPGRK